MKARSWKLVIRGTHRMVTINWKYAATIWVAAQGCSLPGDPVERAQAAPSARTLVDAQIHTVSIASLIAAPSTYDGKIVTIIGWLSAENVPKVYLSRDDQKFLIVPNSITLHGGRTSKTEVTIGKWVYPYGAKYSEQPHIVTGRFIAKQAFDTQGTFADITRFNRLAVASRRSARVQNSMCATRGCSGFTRARRRS